MLEIGKSTKTLFLSDSLAASPSIETDTTPLVPKRFKPATHKNPRVMPLQRIKCFTRRQFCWYHLIQKTSIFFCKINIVYLPSTDIPDKTQNLVTSSEKPSEDFHIWEDSHSVRRIFFPLTLMLFSSKEAQKPNSGHRVRNFTSLDL